MNPSVKKWAKYLNRHLSKEDIQRASKHMKRCSTSYVIRELQIKMRQYYAPIRMTKIQNTENIQILARMWSNRDSDSLLVGVQNGIDILEDGLMVS